MDLEKRIRVLESLGEYMLGNAEAWENARFAAERMNPWFTQEFILRAIQAIASQFLSPEKLRDFAARYNISEPPTPKTVGIVMAGNIPLVGFHDFLCIFLAGHTCRIKLSSKDSVLLKHLAAQMIGWEPELANTILFSDMLKDCNAYIATGSNNTARYFDYYFKKYPHIIRRNRSSVAIIDGTESSNDLEFLSDAINIYFGLGCRNITKLYVPAGYDFIPLLNSLNKYRYFFDHSKYHNNYDYQLAILLLDKKFYMTNGSVLLVENENIFSPISQLHFGYYDDKTALLSALSSNDDIQCIAGEGLLPFSQIQDPALTDFADNVDTMQFLTSL